MQRKLICCYTNRAAKSCSQNAKPLLLEMLFSVTNNSSFQNNAVEKCPKRFLLKLKMFISLQIRNLLQFFRHLHSYTQAWPPSTFYKARYVKSIKSTSAKAVTLPYITVHNMLYYIDITTPQTLRCTVNQTSESVSHCSPNVLSKPATDKLILKIVT